MGSPPLVDCGEQLAQFGVRVQGRAQRGRHRRLGGFLPLVDAFWVDIHRLRGGLGQTVLLIQAQGFGTEDRIVLEVPVGVWRVFRDEGKTLP